MLLCVVKVVFCDLPVGVGTFEPQLHAAARGFEVGGIKVGTGPDLFTHVFGCGVNVSPLSALAALGAFVNTCREAELFKLQPQLLYFSGTIG